MKAIFHKDFNYTSRKTNAGWAIKASPFAQSYPTELITAAVSAGVAYIPAPKREKPDNEPD